jgi:uncharacterized protein with GYD domain
MALYMYQASYTAKSMAAQLKEPQDPVEAIRPTLEDLGATIVVAGFPFGEYDVLVVYEAPDDMTAASVAMAVAAEGEVKSAKTTRLLSGQEWLESLRKRRIVTGLIVVAVNRMPAAEVEVSADLVRRLLADQHPDLARLPVEFLANGWDNELYRVGDGLIARLPRRALGARSSRTSSAGCPGSPRRCPCPSLIQNGPGFPPRLPLLMERGALPAGRARGAGQLLRPGASRGRRRRVPRRAARPRPGGRAGQPVPRCPAGRAGRQLRGQPRPAHCLTGQDLDRDAVLRGWDAALAAPGYDGPPLWLHGDLHPANILVNDGQVSGVIDFGDITAGDPASDLSVAWMLLPPGCHASFWSAYQAAGGSPAWGSGRRRPAGAGQRLGAELRDRVPGPLRRQSGTPGSRPPHPAHRAGGSARTSRDERGLIRGRFLALG